MKWQEYQEAVGQLYEQMSDFGIVRKNITIPDKITGQSRQIDVWWEANIGDHKVNFLVDAKLRKDKLDVKDVEEVLMLAKSVNAHSAIIVCNSGWTQPAEKKADFEGMKLKVFSIEDALEIFVEDKWFMCPNCNRDCVVMSEPGFREEGGLVHWWLRGDCRECDTTYLDCQDCGVQGLVTNSESFICCCSYEWKKQNDQLLIMRYPQSQEFIDPDQMILDF